MRIRRGKISDINELYNLLNEPKELQVGVEGAIGYTKYWIKAYLVNRRNYLSLIAEENKKLAGFILAEISKDRKSSFLTDIFIKKEYRGRGIAYKLMQEYHKICKKLDIKEIQCLVQIKNKRMQKFMKNVKWNKGYSFYLYGKTLR